MEFSILTPNFPSPSILAHRPSSGESVDKNPSFSKHHTRLSYSLTTGGISQCRDNHSRITSPTNGISSASPLPAQCFAAPSDGRRKLHGFTLLRTKHVPELELTALYLRHDRTGAEHLHIARDDSNNVFSINFKTNPPDDTGVPHILEHTTLCGSEKSAAFPAVALMELA
jgi:hypothetical protein